MSSDSHNPADAHQREGERKSDLAVMGQDEYKNKRRLERILDAHDRIEENDNENLAPFVKGRISKDAKDILLLRAVKQFTRECYNMLLDYADELEKEEDRYWYGRQDDPIGVIEFANGRGEVFYGLRDILRADRLYSESYTEQVSELNKPPRKEERIETQTVPEDVSWEAFLRLKEFLEKERGLDLSFEPEGDPHGKT